MILIAQAGIAEFSVVINTYLLPEIERPVYFFADRPFWFWVCNYSGSLVASAATAATSAAVVAAASTAATAATSTALLRLEAVAAEYRTIAPGFKRNRGLLAAARTNYRSSRGCARAITAPASAITAAATTTVPTAATTSLVGFLGLSAGLAALRRRISTFLEERLVSSSKCKFPSAVATGKLQISSHCVSPFSVCENP